MHRAGDVTRRVDSGNTRHLGRVGSDHGAERPVLQGASQFLGNPALEAGARPEIQGCDLDKSPICKSDAGKTWRVAFKSDDWSNLDRDIVGREAGASFVIRDLTAIEEEGRRPPIWNERSLMG
jgi:hypothetical protein